MKLSNMTGCKIILIQDVYKSQKLLMFCARPIYIANYTNIKTQSQASKMMDVLRPHPQPQRIL